MSCCAVISCYLLYLWRVFWRCVSSLLVLVLVPGRGVLVQLQYSPSQPQRIAVSRCAVHQLPTGLYTFKAALRSVAVLTFAHACHPFRC